MSWSREQNWDVSTFFLFLRILTPKTASSGDDDVTLQLAYVAWTHVCRV